MKPNSWEIKNCFFLCSFVILDRGPGGEDQDGDDDAEGEDADNGGRDGGLFGPGEAASGLGDETSAVGGAEPGTHLEEDGGVRQPRGHADQDGRDQGESILSRR